MNDQDFKDFVHNHCDMFRGIKVSELEIRDIEELLGIHFPSTMKWILRKFGVTRCSGIDNLRRSHLDTIRFRSALKLPENVLFLNDWGDAGVVIGVQRVIENDYDLSVIWMSASSLDEYISTGVIPDDSDVFDTYADWVVKCVDIESEL
ncbi:MAG TPA: hypothetical protein PKO15_11575 [Fibrobacteria bacterium]|nr:hypothetical protein [Fibrobacteria bacterium]